MIEVVVEYDQSSKYGPFRIRDEQDQADPNTQGWINSIPGNCDTCSDARLVNLGNELANGVLMYGPPRPTSVTWLNGDHTLVVIGPGDLTEDQATTIASEVETGVGK